MDKDTEDNSLEGNTKYKDGVNRNARIIVRNISFKATEGSLREHFSQYGTVEEVKLLKKPNGRLVGCGFVHYTHVHMANKAISAANQKPFLDRPIQVSWAVPKYKYTEQTQGTDNVRKSDTVPLDNKKKLDLKEEASIDNKNEDKNKVRINRNARLIIRNMSFKATEESLKEHFEHYGTILEVKLLKKPDGKLVGCAFVHFKNIPMAKKALLSTNMKPFLGRPISVDWAVPKNKYMQHIVNQELEMQEQVKKEDSDSDDDNDPPLNLSNDEVKEEIKTESSGDSDNENSDGQEQNDDNDNSDDEDEESDDEQEEDDIGDDNSETSAQLERKRIKLNDAEDGCTVFLTNIPFSIDNDLLKEFAERTGPVKYALVCIDKMTEHSKGSGFIKFLNQEDADKFLNLPPAELKLEGQIMQPKPALKKENVQKGNKKQPKDNRNLYLVKEGVVVAGTKAAVGVSASDMAKRLALERSKTQMLKNLNRFVSRYRIVVSNLPPNCNDARLRRICSDAAGRRALITEARIMRDLRSPMGTDGKHPSKGYGFVMFMKHEDALTCLRKLNNNPDILDNNNRPIVSFSIEDRTALNARKKRLEKSIANNPLANKDGKTENNRRNRKRKSNAPPDESYVKKGRLIEDKKEFKKKEVGRFVRKPTGDEFGEYTGLTVKEGTQHNMRSNQKLKAQADIHRQNVKLEKKKSKRALRLKKANRERIKLPKQKINNNKSFKRNKKSKTDWN